MKTSFRLAGLILCAITLQTCTSNSRPDDKPRTLLAIFAHPDDESSVAPVLAKYAAEGVNVYLCIATDGRLGINEHAKIPAGDSLAAIRKQEMICAAEKLGIHPPIMFGLHDQLKMSEGNSAFNSQMDSLRKGIVQLFKELKPDVVVTWGASGWTGHHDHRLINSVVTEVFESQAWTKPALLYYAAIPTGSIPEDSLFRLSTVDKKFLTVTVPVDDNDYKKSAESLQCHKSQYTPEQMASMNDTYKLVYKNTWYFQSHTSTAIKQTLF